MREINSFSFYSLDLNDIKFIAFVNKGLSINTYKNYLSTYIKDNFNKVMNISKFDWYNLFGKTDNDIYTDDNIRSEEYQLAVEDVYNCYENKIKKVKAKIDYFIQTGFTSSRYKKKN